MASGRRCGASDIRSAASGRGFAANSRPDAENWHPDAAQRRRNGEGFQLPPFKKLAQTIRNHWEGILAYFPHRITSATIESINGIIQTARRRARGFRNFENLKAICYWMAGHLDLQIPPAFTHPI